MNGSAFIVIAHPRARVPGGASAANTTYFPDSGHNLRFGFREYWRANGGVRVFGYPLSEAFSEVSPDDGQPYTVQYCERAKFEYHPASPRPIQLARLGLLALERSGQPASGPTAQRSTTTSSTATTSEDFYVYGPGVTPPAGVNISEIGFWPSSPSPGLKPGAEETKPPEGGWDSAATFRWLCFFSRRLSAGLG